MFLTKKARAEMKARRKKKQKAALTKEEVATETSTSEENATAKTTTTTNMVSGKNTKKKEKANGLEKSTLGKEAQKSKKRKRLEEEEEEEEEEEPRQSEESPKADALWEPHWKVVRDAKEWIVIPSPAGLTSKERKKFRKVQRRKVRASGRDDSLVRFLKEDGTPDEEEEEAAQAPLLEPLQKRPRKAFPKIKELVQAHRQQQQRQKEQRHSRSGVDAALTDEEKARYVALDCEMVGVGLQGRKSALARASLTDWDGKVLLDTYVKVTEKITDYRTAVSGIQAKHLRQKKAMTLTDCRLTVQGLLKGKILVGHALGNDLDALVMNHPPRDVRDTSRFWKFRQRGGRMARKLKDLAKEFLDRDIQSGSHSSVEDATAAMELYKYCRDEWEEQIVKDPTAAGVAKRRKRQLRNGTSKK